MKIGIDIHGVIDRDPEFFAAFTKELRKKGHSVHILTGHELNNHLIKEVNSYGVEYDSLFSITTYQKGKGTHVTYADDEKMMPLVAPPKWDRSKGEYAMLVGLDIHIDDSKVYGRYFPRTTQYLMYTEQIRKFLMVLFGMNPKQGE